MHNKKIFLWCLIFTFLFTCLLQGGCSKKPEQKPKPKSNQAAPAPPKEPKELKEIKKDIESIIKGVQKKQEAQKQMSTQGKDQESSGEKTQKSSSKQKSRGTTDAKKKQQSSPQNWTEEEKKLTSIHQKWNTVEINATSIGAPSSVISDFETNLDHLTDMVMVKDKIKTLNAANELYGIATKIAGLYQTENPPQADMMKYYYQKTALAVEAKNWPVAAQNTICLRHQWEKVKTMLGEKGGKLITQMDYAINDYAGSIEKNNKEVAIIKGQIVSAYIEKAIKEAGKAKKK